MHKLHVCILEAFYPVNEDDVKAGGTKECTSGKEESWPRIGSFARWSVALRSVMARWSIECNVSARSLFSVLSVFQTFINEDEDLEPSFLSSFPVFGLFYHFYGFLDSSLVPGSNFFALNVKLSAISLLVSKLVSKNISWLSSLDPQPTTQFHPVSRV